MINNFERTQYFLPNLTSLEAARAAKNEKSVVILPVASIEQHGPHLPVFTDSIIMQEMLNGIVSNLPKGFPAWFLPVLCYGKSNEHAGLPGTITLTSETLIRVLKEIAVSIAASGFKRFAILNTHGGNTEIIDFVIRDIRQQTGMLVFSLPAFLRIASPAVGISDSELIYGIHAGDVETSMLLACRPELVHMELAPVSLPVQANGAAPFNGPLTFAWLTRDLSRSGALGDATTANADRGRQYLDDAAYQICGLLEEIGNFQFPVYS
jgi:creatinine amidohydrolase